MPELNYEKDISIDEEALDIEWLELPQLVLRYGKNVKNRRGVVTQLEEQKKTKRSELIMEANRDPEGCCNKTKPNKEDIEAYYRTHEDYKGIMEQLLDAQEELEYAEIAYNIMCFSKREALENLVILHGQQYFAGPKVPRQLTKEWEQRRRQRLVDKKVNLKRSR